MKKPAAFKNNSKTAGKPVKISTEDAFRERVLKVVASIPKGKMMTYQEVAQRAGSPMAYRAVGTIMSRNWDPAIPCHRVIRADGVLGNYNRGAAKKIDLLRKEGAIPKNAVKVVMKDRK